MSFGLDRTELVAAVKDVQVEDGRLDAGHRPRGLSITVPPYDGPTTGTGDVQVDLGLELRKQSSAGEPHLVVHQTRDSSWQAPERARPVAIHGAVGWIFSNGNRISVRWQLAPGVIGSLGTETIESETLRLARSTKKVPLNDPRFRRP